MTIASMKYKILFIYSFISLSSSLFLISCNKSSNNNNNITVKKSIVKIQENEHNCDGFSTHEYNGHTYIIYSKGYNPSIIHDPSCSCYN